MKKAVLLLFGILLLSNCTKRQPHKQQTEKDDVQVNLSYSDGFSIKEKENYKEVIVFSPWERDAVYARYYLVKNEKQQTPADGIKIKVPLESIASTSVTHLEFLNLLEEVDKITAICSPRLVYNRQVQNYFSTGKITDLGDAFSLNVEKIIALNPDGLMMSGYNQTDVNAERVQQAGIPVIYNNEWMETSLLARAEWIKFVAVFFDKSHQADSIFRDIETRYDSVKIKLANVSYKPKIISGSNFRGTWYMPGGHSYMSELYKDAGADYFYANDTTSGSLPLNFEIVLKNFAGTDFWLNCNFNTIDELIQADKKHELFRPVKENRVYNFNKRLLPSGANDFWESAVARPDLLLGDVAAILHPELMPNREFVYAKHLTRSLNED
ncbi:MAG: ABC transporter substrate-binding protein [Paludibacteraceae bacterium]